MLFKIRASISSWPSIKRFKRMPTMLTTVIKRSYDKFSLPHRKVSVSLQCHQSEASYWERSQYSMGT